jgi:hypothetical protein
MERFLLGMQLAVEVVQAVTDSETARTTPSLSILILFPSPSLWISRVRRRVREGKVLKEVRVNLVQKEERKGNKIDMPLTAYD